MIMVSLHRLPSGAGILAQRRPARQAEATPRSMGARKLGSGHGWGAVGVRPTGRVAQAAVEGHDLTDGQKLDWMARLFQQEKHGPWSLGPPTAFGQHALWA